MPNFFGVDLTNTLPKASKDPPNQFTSLYSHPPLHLTPNVFFCVCDREEQKTFLYLAIYTFIVCWWTEYTWPGTSRSSQSSDSFLLLPRVEATIIIRVPCREVIAPQILPHCTALHSRNDKRSFWPFLQSVKWGQMLLASYQVIHTFR